MSKVIPFRNKTPELTHVSQEEAQILFAMLADRLDDAELIEGILWADSDPDYLGMSAWVINTPSHGKEWYIETNYTGGRVKRFRVNPREQKSVSQLSVCREPYAEKGEESG